MEVKRIEVIQRNHITQNTILSINFDILSQETF